MTELAVLVNRHAGRRRRDVLERVAQALRAEGAEPSIRSLHGSEVHDAARELAGRFQVVVVCGGDGTVSAAAHAVAGTDTALGVLPFGTLNHFAKDVGVPLDLESAARTVVRGETRAVDVAVVGDRVFVNNSSIGIYPWTVRRRESLKPTLRSKWAAMAMATVATLGRFPRLRVTVAAGGERIDLETPGVFVGNNRYRAERFGPIARERVDRGTLCLWAPRSARRADFLRLVARGLAGRLDGAADFVERCVPRITIEGGSGAVLVALDGEIECMRWPLSYHVRPGALRVRLPRESAPR